jgi:hypothetical protein
MSFSKKPDPAIRSKMACPAFTGDLEKGPLRKGNSMK